MAMIRQRGKSWQATVKRKGYPNQVKTFTSKAPAAAWARKTETSMDNGSWIDTRAQDSHIIDHIIDQLIYSYTRFGLEVCGPKLGQLNMLKRHFQGQSIHDLTADDILDFAADRRKEVAASTLQYQIYYFKQALTHSRIRTEVDAIDIAITELKKKKIIMGSEERDRRLEKGEYELLMGAVGPQRSRYLAAAIDIAIESGMRQGEIHALKWSMIDFDKGLITLWRKNKHAEGGKKKAIIPLLKGVREALVRHQNVLGKADVLFEVKRAASISDAFAKLRKKVGIYDMHFHDLRHEAISRLFESGMSVAQVRLISGHSSFDQLSRYVNLRPEDLVDL
jgi:integrase